MFDRAEKALRAGHSVVLDAVFAHESERNITRSIADRAKARFMGVWLEAQPAVLKSRVAARTGDASDANAAVIDTQLGYDLGSISWNRIDASGTRDETIARVRGTLPSIPAARP